MSILTFSSPKLDKGVKFGFLSAVLYLMPADFARLTKRGEDVKPGQRAFTLCPMASEGCKASCLVTAGRASMAKEFDEQGLPVNTIMQARQRRTREFLSDREGFVERLLPEIRLLIKRATREGKRAALRLNGTSDILWSQNAVVAAHIRPMVERGELTLYDYTKVAANLYRAPAWYDLTLSRSEANASAVSEALENNHKVAVVFAGKLPATYLGHRVVDGDEHDLTFLHKGPIILGLKAKGRAKKDETGFVVRNHSVQA